jgi:8-oxo-dGTP pyrophosphatase MutT (NUDIX family)
MNDNYCNNCGKLGHQYHQCKLPIISIGIIAFRKLEEKIEYLMIRRRDTLGFIDFMRGKYSIYNKDYIMNMLKQMTEQEKQALLTKTFHELWNSIWGSDVISNQYKAEESISRDKFASLSDGVLIKTEFYTLRSLVDESRKYGIWQEAEWGFPKGRRNYQETDYECALREFAEETGYSKKSLININNILPFEEIFTGSNYKSYKHKYFVAYMDYDFSNQPAQFEPTEVSKMEWKSYEECIDIIRPYNLEKKQLITNIHNMLIQ